MDDPELFDLALSLPAKQRESAIREACGGDAERAARLLELVHLADRAEPTSSGESSVPGPSEPSRLPEGALVGRYVIASLLGQGGFGQVYEAFDLELERRVALKILRDDRHATEQDEQRFRREAQSLAQIDHPNVVRVYDAGRHENRRYLTMELVDGASLRSWLDASPKRGWREVLDTLLPAARGLEAAHAAGIVHRDFKPENVMIEAGGRVVVTDFGIARMLVDPATPTHRVVPAGTPREGSLGTTASVVGTPRYMAPEQLLGRATPRSDEYAFCRVLAEALGWSVSRASVDAATTGTPRAQIHLELRGGRAPRWFRRVIARGLQPAEEHRYPDMATLIDDIERHRARRRWAARMVVAGLAAIPLAYGLVREPALACSQWDERAVPKAFQGTWATLAERTGQAPHPASAATGLAAMQARVEWDLGEWARGRTTTCEQHVNGLLDSATARVRDDCFDDWHRALQRRLEWLVDHPEALGSASLVEELPRNPTRCAHVDAPIIAQPELEPEVRDAIESRLAEAQDLRIRGDYPASVHAAEQALVLAQANGHEAYRAEILRRLGVLAARGQEPERAVELLQQAVLAAERLGLDGLASEAHASLAETVALTSSSPMALAEQSLALAEAKVARHGERHDQLEADLLAIEGHIALGRERYPEAEEAYRRAVLRYEAVNGPRDYLAAAMRSNLARAIASQGRYDEAIALAEAALTARREGIGDEHPLIVGDLLMLGRMYVRAATTAASPEESQARRRAGEASFVASARLARVLHGPRSLPLAEALVELSDVRQQLGIFDEAVAQDIRDFVLVYDDPMTPDVPPQDRARALRIARNVHHAREAWPEALAMAQRLEALERAQRSPLEPELRDDDLMLVYFLLEEGQVVEAGRRLEAHERRYADSYPNDAAYQQTLAEIREELDEARDPTRRNTP